MDRRLFLSGLAGWAAGAPIGRRISVLELGLRPKELERYRLAVRRVHADTRWLAAAAKVFFGGPSSLPVQRGMLYFYERLLNRAAPGDPIRVPYWPWENRYAVPARRVPLIFGVEKDEAELTAEDVDVEPVLALRGADDFLAAAVNGAAAMVESRLRLTPLQPAFWAHLANVDRMWASWIALGEGRKLPEFRQMRAALVDESGLTRPVPLQELRDARTLGYEYSTLMKPLRLGSAQLAPVRIAGGGYVESDHGTRAEERNFLLLRGVRVKQPLGRMGLFAGRWQLQGTFSAGEPELKAVAIPMKEWPAGRPQLLVAGVDEQGKPRGNGAPLEAREAYLF